MQHSENAYQEILNRLTPAQKIQAFLDLYWTARKLKTSALKAQFPQCSDQEIESKVKEIFLYANE